MARSSCNGICLVLVPARCKAMFLLLFFFTGPNLFVQYSQSDLQPQAEIRTRDGQI